MDKIITALEQQKNNPDRINVFINDQFAFGISRYVGAWLKKGEVLDDARIQQLQEQDIFEKAYQTALRYIAYQPRTEIEIRKRLEKAEFDQPVIDRVVQVLGEKNYLDDTQYARDWIESRASSKPRSHKYYSYELKRKGVSDAAIAQALQDAPDDLDLAYKLGCKYLSRYEHLDESEFKKKMHGVLARRAFSYEIIRKTIERLIKKRNLEEN